MIDHGLTCSGDLALPEIQKNLDIIFLVNLISLSMTQMPSLTPVLTPYASPSTAHCIVTMPHLVFAQLLTPKPR